MLINVFPPKKSLKNLIINVLLLHPNEGVDVVGIKRQLRSGYTYQGINKILMTLKKEDIVKKTRKKWKLNPEWLQQINDTVINYQNKEITSYTSDMKSVSFQNIEKALNFLLTNLSSEALKNNGENIFIMHVQYIGFYRLDNKQMELLKKFVKNNECHVLIEHNNFINRITGKFLKSLGCNVYFGVKRSTKHTISVYGNTMFYTFTPKIYATLDKLYQKIKNFSDPRAMRIFDFSKDDPHFQVKFTFETNKEIVGRTREHLLELAKKGKKL
jgi:hypothetical protein